MLAALRNHVKREVRVAVKLELQGVLATWRGRFFAAFQRCDVDGVGSALAGDVTVRNILLVNIMPSSYLFVSIVGQKFSSCFIPLSLWTEKFVW